MAESDLADAEDIRKQMTKWILQKSMEPSTSTSSNNNNNTNSGITEKNALIADSKTNISAGKLVSDTVTSNDNNVKESEADLYDF